MKKIFAILLCAMLIVSSAVVSVFAEELPVDTTDEADPYAFDEEYYSKFKGQNVKLYVYNWGEYIADGSDGSEDVIKMFEDLTGIDVEYTTFDTNEGLFSKLQSGSAYYDVIIPSDYMISRMIEKDMLEKLDFANIPNFEKYVSATFKSDVEYDPTMEYSVPYTWGTVGIIYNTKYVTKTVDSWDILWDEDYKGKILMFDNSRDAFAIALEKLGYSVNTENEDEINEAAELLKEQKPLVQAYVMDQIFDKMEEENAWVAPYYAGDFITMHEENENLAFAFPKEGSNFFVDAMCIPKGSKNKEAAEMFINFMCEPKISAENCGATGYSTPIDAAKELIDPDLAANEYAYPSEEILSKTEKFINLSDETNKLLDDLWITISVGGLSTGFWIAVAAVVIAVIAICIVAMNKKKKRELLRNSSGN